MSEMMEMMKSLKDIDKGSKSDEKESDEKESDDTDPDSFGQAMIEDVEILKTVKGITNVTSTSDTIKGIYSLEFDFENDAALNDALNKTGDKKEKAENVYSIKNSSVTITDYNMMKEFEEKSSMDSKEALQFAQGMMEEIKYHLSIQLPGTIKSVSNKKAEISDDKRSVTIETNVKDLSEKKVTTGMKISYK